MDWNSLILVNGWGNYGSPYQTAQYGKCCGRIWLRGLVSPPSSTSFPQVIANLPTGFRPLTQQFFTVIAGNTVLCQIDVLPTGDVLFQGPVNIVAVNFIGLGGITFTTD